MKPIITLEERLQEMIDHRTERSKGQRKITTGHVELDKIIGGFRLPSVNFIAGRPGAFAKEIAFNLAHRIANDKVRVGVIYSSVNEFDITAWQLSTVLKTPISEFLLSDSIELQLKALRRAREKSSEIPLLMNKEKPRNFSDFLSKAQKMVDEGVQLILLDSLLDVGQLSLLSVQDNVELTEDIWRQMFTLRDFAEKNNIAFLIAHMVQQTLLNEHWPYPRIEELMWANAVDNIADTIILTYWTSVLDIECDSNGYPISENEIEFTLAKNAFGRQANFKMLINKEPIRLV